MCPPSPQICGSFSARAGVQGHIKMHHAHTNVIGLGDSSVWKVPFLPRTIYLFIAPLTVPIITPLVALGERRHRTRDGLWAHANISTLNVTQRKTETSNHLILFMLPCYLASLTRLWVYSHACDSFLILWSCSSPQRALCGPHREDHADGNTGPVFTVLAADPRVRLPVASHRPALHAGVQSHVLGAVHPRQHFPGEKYLQPACCTVPAHHMVLSLWGSSPPKCKSSCYLLTLMLMERQGKFGRSTEHWPFLGSWGLVLRTKTSLKNRQWLHTGRLV